MSNTAVATLKYALTSEKKMNLIAKLVKNMKALEALDVLKFTQKRPANILYKVVKSALANAESKGIKASDLFIDRIEVGRWPKLKRIKFVSRSRVNYFIRHRSFVKVILNTK